MNKVLEFIIENWDTGLEISGILLVILLRVIPTEKNRDILKRIFQFLDKIIPNLKKGGGTHIIILLCLISFGSFAQQNIVGKAYSSTNADSVLSRSTGTNLFNTYGGQSSTFYYNWQDTANPRWRILVDSAGVGVWRDMFEDNSGLLDSIKAGNGLSVVGADSVILGGSDVTEDVALNVANEKTFSIHSLSSDSYGTEQVFYSEPTFSQYNLDVEGSNEGAGFLARLNGVDNFATSMYGRLNASISKIELTSGSGMTVTDGIGSKGLVYAADYSANFTARSLPDKAYVDAQTVTASNGLTKTGNNITLGGALTGVTSISGLSTLSFTNSTTTFSGATLNIQPTTWNISTAPSITAGTKFTFAPSATTAGINLGGVAGNPSAPVDGDMWYDNSGTQLTARINGTNRNIATTTQTQTLTNKTLGSSTTFSASPTINAGIKFTFSPDATNSGLNVGSFAGSPSAPTAGDIWYNSTINSLVTRNNVASNPVAQGTLTAGRVPYASTTGTGLLLDDAGFTFSTTNDVLTVGRLSALTTTTTPALGIGGFAGDPSALTNGDVWYNSTTGKFRARQNGSSVDLISSATAAGSDKQVQYNSSGAFGAEAGFEYDPATNLLSSGTGGVGGIIAGGTSFTDNIFISTTAISTQSPTVDPTFSISGDAGNSTTNNAVDLSIFTQSAYAVAGNGRGGDINFQTGGGRAAGSGRAGDINMSLNTTGNTAGSFVIPGTTAAGTGNVTINNPTGQVRFAAAATTLTVTNSSVKATDMVFCTVLTNDATAVIKNVVCAAGSFTITLNAAATAETYVGFFVVDSNGN